MPQQLVGVRSALLAVYVVPPNCSPRPTLLSFCRPASTIQPKLLRACRSHSSRSLDRIRHAAQPGNPISCWRFPLGHVWPDIHRTSRPRPPRTFSPYFPLLEPPVTLHWYNLAHRCKALQERTVCRGYISVYPKAQPDPHAASISETSLRAPCSTYVATETHHLNNHVGHCAGTPERHQTPANGPVHLPSPPRHSQQQPDQGDE